LTSIPAIIRRPATRRCCAMRSSRTCTAASSIPLEEAAAYQQLLDDFGCTHGELAERLGRSRPQVSNTLRLLGLPAPVQRRVAAGVLSAGHARALLSAPDAAAQERLAERVVAEGLSVRNLEELVALGAGGRRRAARRHTSTAPELAEVETRSASAWRPGFGSAAVPPREHHHRVASLDDLERIVALIAPGQARWPARSAPPVLARAATWRTPVGRAHAIPRCRPACSWPAEIGSSGSYGQRHSRGTPSRRVAIPVASMSRTSGPAHSAGWRGAPRADGRRPVAHPSRGRGNYYHAPWGALSRVIRRLRRGGKRHPWARSATMLPRPLLQRTPPVDGGALRAALTR
jgi:hypothetical protein